jgi:LysM repeat protein
LNTNLLGIVKQIVDGYGETVLTDPRRLKAFFADLAREEPKPLRLAFGRCIEADGYTALKTASGAAERASRKALVAQRLRDEHGLDPILCAEAMDILEAALFGEVSGAPQGAGSVAPSTAPRPAPQRMPPQEKGNAAPYTAPKTPPAAPRPAPQRKPQVLATPVKNKTVRGVLIKPYVIVCIIVSIIIIYNVAIKKNDVTISPVSQETAEPLSVPEPEEFFQPRMLLFSSYTLKQGDTVGEVAKRFGLNAGTLISLNKITIRSLKIGLTLKVPNQDGVYHTIKKGETLESITKKYKADVVATKVANELFSDQINPNKDLFIPGAVMPREEE